MNRIKTRVNLTAKSPLGGSAAVAAADRHQVDQKVDYLDEMLWQKLWVPIPLCYHELEFMVSRHQANVGSETPKQTSAKRVGCLGMKPNLAIVVVISLRPPMSLFGTLRKAMQRSSYFG